MTRSFPRDKGPTTPKPSGMGKAAPEALLEPRLFPAPPASSPPSARQTDHGPFGFDEAVRRVLARCAMYIARQEELPNGVYQTRQLLVTMGGHLYLRIDGHDEQRHLTARDVQATDWRETL